MSSILASVSVLLGAEISEFKAKMAEARRELKGLVQFSEGLKDVGKSLTTYVTAPLLALGAGAVLASGKIEALRNALTAINTQDLARDGATGLGALTRAAELTKDRMKELEVLARQPGLGFEQAVQGDVRLRAVGISAEQSAKSLKAFANAIALTGGGKSEFASVTVQLAQLSAKGKVLAQDLRPIIEAAPAVSGALQKLYGTVDSETISASLQKQGKSSTDFIAILTDELGKLPQVTGSLKNSLENFADTATLSLAKLGDGISQALNLPAVLASVSDFVTGLADRFASLSPATQKLVVVLAGVAAATGPVLLALGTIGAATPAVIAGFGLLTSGSLSLSGALGTALKAAMAALLTPTGAVIAVLATLAAVVYAGVTANERAYESFRKQAAATRELDTAVTPLLNRYEELKSKTSLSAAEQEELRSVVEKVTAIMPEAGTKIDQYGNFIEIAADKARASIAVFKGLDKDIALASLPAAKRELKELEEAYAGAQKGAQTFSDTSRKEGLSDALRAEQLGYFRESIASLGAKVQEQRQRVTDFQAAINGLSGALEDASVANAVFGDSVGSIAGGLGQQVGLLAELEERLKAAREAKPNLATEAEIAATNQLIASLEAQIKRLNELGIASKKAQDALAKLAAELRGNGQLSTALGSDYDFLKERQKILEGGLKALVLAGVSPASRAFRQYAAQLKELNTVLGDNAPLQLKQLDGLMALARAGENDGFGNKIKKNPLTGKALESDDRPKELKTLPIDASATVQSLTQFQAFALKFQADLQETTEGMASSFAGAFSGIAQGVGQALASGQDAMQAFGDGLLRALGQIIVQFGEKLILMGIGNIALQNYAVGAAQLAAGGLLTGAGAYIGATAGGRGGQSTTTSRNYSSGGNYGQGAPQRVQVEVVGTLKAYGSDLKAVLRTTDYRNLRTG